MSRELRYIHNPWRTRAIWLTLYCAIFIVGALVFYVFVARVRTHVLPVGGVQIQVPYSKYLVGEPISVTVTNNFNSAVYVTNRCPAEPLGVYRLENNTWVRLHDTANKQCLNEARQVSLPSHKSLTLSLASWQHLFNTAGKYRVVLLIDSSDALPYQDFEIVDPPKPIAAAQPSNASRFQGTSSMPSGGSSSISSSATTSAAGAGSSFSAPSPGSNPSSSPTYAPVNYTVHVTRSGIYDNTSLQLHATDTVTFVYSSSGDGEVITRFAGSPAISPVTVDQERRSRTVTFASAGTWTFYAQDQSGNRGTITVN